MTVEKIYQIITLGIKRKISEMEMIMRIQKFTNLDWKRSVAGYKIMRESGMINNIVDRDSVGLLEIFESNKKIMMLINKLECVPTDITTGKMKPLKVKMSFEYGYDEIIPVVKSSRHEIYKSWCNESLRRNKDILFIDGKRKDSYDIDWN
jgi:hypothetical protein